MDTTDFESVASAVYEAIDSQLEPEEDEADDDGDMDDEEIQQYAKSSQCPSGDERSVATDHPHRSEEEMGESSLNLQLQMDNETSPFVREKRSAPLIVQDDSGLIKKIKISTAKNLVQRFTQNMAANKTEKVIIKGLQQVSSNTQHQQQQQQQQPRSSTPLSREYLALQKTQNDSKIIKKFVTDAMIEKTRKGKAKDSNNSFGSPTATPTSSNAGATPMIATSSDHSYTFRRRSNNNSLISPEKDNTDSHSISQTKRHRRFVPLKDADDDDSATLQQPQRSRSKSMHNSSDHSDEHSNASSSHQMLKKWPSEERFPVGVKRTNMRSENSDFVQKQKDFLQQVINSTQDTPQRTHSRSRSIGGDSDSNPPPIKPRKSKERSSKRLAAEFEQGEQDKEVIPPPRTRSRSRSAGVDSFTTESANPTTSKRSKSKRSKDDTLNDDSADKQSQSQSIVMECSTTTDDHGDGADSSLNNSHNSTLATNTSSSADVTTTTTTTTATATTTTYAENVDSLENHLKKMWQPPPKPGSDSFCWKCHEHNVKVSCSKCMRSFHSECAKAKLDSAWICSECTTVDNILNSTKKSSRRNELSVDLLSQLLAFALKRMRYAKGNYSFVMPYEEVSINKKYIVYPVHFGMLQEKIDSKEYRCTEEFVNDTKWMLHNAYILSSGNNTKLVMGTKAIIKICRQEVNEIETCAECYLNANTRTDWFVDVCSQPHLLLWAKLKGFPYWPAKAMGFGQNSLVNVRFFGQHDRAFVSVKECYLYSVQDPNAQTGKKAARELADCMKEVEEHIERIKNKVGAFKYAPFKTPYDPTDEMAQLESMMPGVQEFIKKQQILISKPSLQFKIYKTADNNLSIVQKASSTPDLPSAHLQQQQQPHQQQEFAEDLPSSAKKKKSASSSNEEEKKSEEMSAVPAAKYEVISKVTSDDSNSSKLSTVILKRKAACVRTGDDTKKNSEEDAPNELPLPKMQRIEETTNGIDDNKRKVEILTAEKVKEKFNSKQELKIPAITIKTTTAISKDTIALGNDAAKATKVDNEVTEKDKSSQSSVSSTQASIPPASMTTTMTATATATTQKVVENLVKNKQGVTIKKILNETAASPTMNPVSAVDPTTADDNALVVKSSSSNPAISQGDQTSNEKQTDDKHLQDQVTSIIKGLVPFVEFKREPPSDNEETEATEETPNTPTEELDKQTTANTPVTHNTRSHAKEPRSASNNDSNSRQKDVEASATSVLIAHVKQEVFSDDDEEGATRTPENSKQQSSSSPSTQTNRENNNPKPPSSDVRVVGDTTIQKLSIKNTAQLTSTTMVQPPAKRITLKGIPYGPLPASAFPKINMESPKNDALAGGTLPRAKKSFPQFLPNSSSNNSNDKLRSSPDNSNVNGNNQGLDSNKRAMSKNTMVAIPVDRTSSSSSLGTIISNVPVPPLTAVSKIVPSSSSNLYNSMARNSTVMVNTVSGTSGGGSSITVPAVVTTKSNVSTFLSSASFPSPVVSRNSPPITVVNSIPPTYTFTTSSVSSSVTSTSTTTSTVTATNSSNYVNALALSTPPPLAGLSGVNLQTNCLTNGGSACIIATTPPATEASSSTTTTTATTPTSSSEAQAQAQQQHVPTEALTSAITDGLCRSLPKLVAKPKGGLLQSEERPIFPSQAGPVCNRLFHNSFKVADVLITVLEDTINEVAQGDEGSLQAKLTLATMELERAKLANEEMRKSAELEKNRLLKNMENEKNRLLKNMENEKNLLISETRKQCQLEWKQRELELKRVIEETKRKQWCAQCGREANFYCCWNTSYCDYPCQQLHWGWHAANCAQTRTTAAQETTQSPASSNNMQTVTGLPEQRNHITKSSNHSNNSTTLITPANVNIKSTTTLKKEKSLGKSASSNSLLNTASSSLSATTASSRNNNSAEVLKLPTNTYIRPVSNSMGQQSLRCNTTYSIPVQRFNTTLPITTPAANSTGPHTFTIVHQGNSSWVMSSGSSAANAAGGTNSTVSAPTVSVPQIGQHRSGGSIMTANKSPKSQIRHH